MENNKTREIAEHLHNEHGAKAVDIYHEGELYTIYVKTNKQSYPFHVYYDTMEGHTAEQIAEKIGNWLE